MRYVPTVLLMQRCLSLYMQGLCSVFYSNPKLAEAIMDLLLGQVSSVQPLPQIVALPTLCCHFNQCEQYYDSHEDTLPPLKFSSCLSVGDAGASLLEPLVSLTMYLVLFQ